MINFFKKTLFGDAPKAPQRRPLSIVIVGHVDHGKSTVIGRLLFETNALPEARMRELETISKKRGTIIEWSFLLDSFQAERDQAITIDTTQMRFKTPHRDVVIIDAPGHREFLKNMISGAAQADAALLVVDAEEGMREQTRRHAYLLSLLGIRQVAVVINKMDKVGYQQARFEDVADHVRRYLAGLDILPSHIVPLAARDGDMLVQRGTMMPWYVGKTVLEILDTYEPRALPVTRPLRFCVQDVYRFDERRILVGRIESGILRKGDTLLFSPTGEKAVVTGFEEWPVSTAKVEAKAGEVIGITLDQPIFVERGHIASHMERPPMLSNVFRVNLFWLAQRPLKVGNSYRVRYGTTESMVSVQSIDQVIDTDTLTNTAGAIQVERNQMAQITLRARDLLSIDPARDNPRLGRVVLYDAHDVAGGGLMSMEGYADQRSRALSVATNIHQVDHLVRQDIRAARNGHKGTVIWLTGLSGAGKSTLAMLLERALFDTGYQVNVLDGDNLRHGLNVDLGFSPEDRAENVRRAGEAAALMADAGMVCISSFISPYRSDRDRVRKACQVHGFHEIYVRADLATCEERDPKGLYKKARAGLIKLFTGIDSPYEEPENPELIIDTQHNDIETCVAQLMDYVEGVTRVPHSPFLQRHPAGTQVPVRAVANG